MSPAFRSESGRVALAANPADAHDARCHCAGNPPDAHNARVWWGQVAYALRVAGPFIEANLLRLPARLVPKLSHTFLLSHCPLQNATQARTHSPPEPALHEDRFAVARSGRQPTSQILNNEGLQFASVLVRGWGGECLEWRVVRRY